MLYITCLPLPSGLSVSSPLTFIQATGIVEYASADDAAGAVAHVHGKLILGRPVTAWVPVPGNVRARSSDQLLKMPRRVGVAYARSVPVPGMRKVKRL